MSWKCRPSIFPQVGRAAEALEALRAGAGDPPVDIRSTNPMLSATESIWPRTTSNWVTSWGRGWAECKTGWKRSSERSPCMIELPRESRASPAVLRGMGDAQFAKSSLLHQMGRAAESFEPMNVRRGGLRATDPSRAPTTWGIRERLGRALMNLGTVATNLNQLDDAGRSFRRALTNYEGLVHDRPNDSRYAFRPRVSPITAWPGGSVGPVAMPRAGRISPGRGGLRSAGPGSSVRRRIRRAGKAFP